jgi:hypothetical protein
MLILNTYWPNFNLIKIIFSSCSRFLIWRCVKDLTKRRRHPCVSDLGSMSELTNQIIVITFKILKAAIWLVNSLIDPRSLPLLINQSNISRDFSLKLSKCLADSDLVVIGLTGIGPIQKISVLDWFLPYWPNESFYIVLTDLII